MTKKTFTVLVLSDEDKARLTKITEGVIDYIETQTKDRSEQAFILKILIESFEETQQCVVPFEKRYTEPTFITHNDE